MRRVDDPDFGPIETPPPPSREEYERAARQIAERARGLRFWPLGSVSDCPNCGAHRFVGRDDLSTEGPRPGGVLIFRHLRGARCEACQAQALEPADLVDLEAEAGVGVVADYEAKVSNIGSGTVGTYWPKDVVRVLGLGPNKKAFITVLDRDTVLIKFRRVRPRPAEAAKKPAQAKASRKRKAADADAAKAEA